MNRTDDIIDITPVESSSTRITDAKAPLKKASASYPCATKDGASAATCPRCFFWRIKGLVMMVFGVIAVLIGIPLLILPGPGLLLIVGGVAVVLAGFKRLITCKHAER